MFRIYLPWIAGPRRVCAGRADDECRQQQDRKDVPMQEDSDETGVARGGSSWWVRVACLSGLCLLTVVDEATAQWCSNAYPQTVECGGQGGCHAYVTSYFCTGFGEGYTCGSPCTGSITCCGAVVGYNPVLCHYLCSGCKREDSRTATTRQPSSETDSGENVVECSKAGGVVQPPDLIHMDEAGARSRPGVTSGKATASIKREPKSPTGQSGARR